MYKKVIVSIWIISVVSLCLSFLPSFAAEPLFITAEGEYVMGAGETMEVAEERARKAAMQSAAEKAGVFVKSYTKVKNLSLESDVIEVIANHAMKVKVLEKKKTPIGDLDAIKFYVKVEATMTEAEIQANLDKVRKDQSIVDAYQRLKADYEKKDRELEKLKRQLELATGGDRRRIVGLISEDEKKFKANIWLGKGQSLGFFQPNEALKAYRKALELNPDLAPAYVGIAEALRFQHMGEPEDVKGLEGKISGLKEALANLDTAISLEEKYGRAYVLRAELHRELMSAENKFIDMGKIEVSEKERQETKWQYLDRILSDLNRAIALQSPNRAELYYWRSGIYQEKAWQYKDDKKFQQALADIDQAISLRKEGDVNTLSGYWRVKANIFINAEGYYLYHGQDEKAVEMRKRSEECYKKVAELEEREMADERHESDKWKAEEKAFGETEFGKLFYDLLEGGWKDRVLGMDRRAISISIEGMSEAEKKQLEEQFEAKRRSIEKKVATGNATAEEYLYWGYQSPHDDPLAEELIAKGLSLLEKRNPEGRDALFLVSVYHVLARGHDKKKQYDATLNYLAGSMAMINKYLGRALESVSLGEYWRMSRVSNEETRITMVKNLNRKQAEAFFWIHFALVVSQLKARIYEKLGLPSQARREYQYLCEELKDEGACKDKERLR